MRHASFALATLLAAAPFATPASGFVTVVAGSLASACYDHARNELSSSRAIDECTGALGEGLDTHNRAGTYVNRGIIFMNRGTYDRALADFDQALALEPTLAEGHINRGAVLLVQHDYAGAIAAIDRGLALNPEDPSRAYYNRGVAHEELGQVREAYRDYRRAAELAPTWDEPRTELARFRVG
ncbi:MAG TPA: tetratricopeptide repeat protein [Candidatus Binatia bacterium]|nr:tetratricopeptide repeat protein [Candidatus Binatia bacterium]